MGARLNIGGAAAIVYVCLLLWQAASFLLPTADLPWYSSSDEAVVVAEVIRFASLRSDQDFFDMPGTPLMLLGAAEWRARYWLSGEQQGIEAYSFAHLQPLFRLMRWNGIGFFVLSGLLLFALAWRLTGPYAAALAVTVLALSPVYAGTVASVRVEPMAMCFLLAALLAVTGIRSTLAASIVAGLAAGLAAGCRLHSITASLPLLMLLLALRTWNSRMEYSKRTARGLAYLGSAGGIAAIVLAVHWRTAVSEAARTFPAAHAALLAACLAAAGAIVLAAALYSLPGTRRLVVNVVTPELAALAAGVAAGFLLGTPTVIPQFDTFLRSLDFYTGGTYRDTAAAAEPLLAQYSSLVRFYVPQIAPDTIVQVLLAAGAALTIAVGRWRRLWPFLAAAAGFFLSKSPGLARAPHHAALWMPYYALLCAVPLAEVLERFAGKWRQVAGIVSLIGVASLTLAMHNGPRGLQQAMANHATRLQQVERARAWVAGNLPKGTPIDAAFYCFGPEVFYSWFRKARLAAPEADYPYSIWWGQRSWVAGRAGYACLTPADAVTMNEWERKRPGEGVNPAGDAHFSRLASFGDGPYQVQLYRFDLR